MKKIELSVPSKTFLLGEYVVIHGGPALVLTTEPRFTLYALLQKTQRQIDIHSKSPAGKWIEQHADFYQQYHLQFNDPHQSKGGFGASGAQFILLEALRQYQNGETMDNEDLLKKF